jgi:hypothetical protein
MLRMSLKVNPLYLDGESGDLDLGRARVALVLLVLGRHGLLVLEVLVRLTKTKTNNSQSAHIISIYHHRPREKREGAGGVSGKTVYRSVGDVGAPTRQPFLLWNVVLSTDSRRFSVTMTVPLGPRPVAAHGGDGLALGGHGRLLLVEHVQAQHLVHLKVIMMIAPLSSTITMAVVLSTDYDR